MGLVARARQLMSSSKTLRNVFFALWAEIAQLVLSLGAFFFLARSLGSAQFGIYSAATALGALAGVIGYMGSQQLMMRDAAAEIPFQQIWSRLLSTVVAATVISTIALVLARGWIMRETSAATFAMLIISFILFFGLTDFAVLAAQAHQKLEIAVHVRLSTGVIRLIGVLIFSLFGNGTLEQFAWIGFIAWGVAAAAALVSVQREFGAKPTLGAVSVRDLRDGAPYTLMSGTGIVLDSIDKPMMVGFGYEADNGLYSSGYRVAALALVPLMAVVRATDKDFFTSGARSLDEAYQLAVKLVKPAAIFGILAGIGLWVFAPLFAALLASDFDGTDDVIRWLAVLPIIRAISIFPANALTGANRQGYRNASLIMSMFLNVGLNLWWIPRFSWRGAAAATLIADVLSTVVMWTALYRLARSERRAHADQVPSPDVHSV